MINKIINSFCKNPTKMKYEEFNEKTKELFEKYYKICIDEKRGNILRARKILNIIYLEKGIPQAHYFKNILNNSEEVYNYFLDQNIYNKDEDSRVLIFGRWQTIPRKQVAYGDQGLTYTFAGVTVPAKKMDTYTFGC